VTSIVVTDLTSGRRFDGIEEAEQHWNEVPDNVIDQVIAKGDIMQCCGGFMVDEGIVKFKTHRSFQS
jgi:septum formation protein